MWQAVTPLSLSSNVQPSSICAPILWRQSNVQLLTSIVGRALVDARATCIVYYTYASVY